MIRSMRTVLCRAILGVLADRQITVFAVSEATRIPLPDLRRLLEFGSPLDPEAADRLIAWSMKMIVVSKPRKAAITKPRLMTPEVIGQDAPAVDRPSGGARIPLPLAGALIRMIVRSSATGSGGCIPNPHSPAVAASSAAAAQCSSMNGGRVSVSAAAPAHNGRPKCRARCRLCQHH